MTGLTLRAAQEQQGGIFGDDAAAPATHFGDTAGEYRHAQQQCALFDLSDREQFALTGPDRVRFLNAFCTANIATLQSGHGCEAFITSVKGRIVGHLFVFAGEETLWLESGAGTAESLTGHLAKYLMIEDAELEPRTEELGTLLVSGPETLTALEHAGAATQVLASWQHIRGVIAGIDVHLRRTDMLGEPGIELIAPRAELGRLWQHLADSGISPAGRDVFEALRIEAGLPNVGIDVTDANLAQEAARTALAISFTKGCYLGQEPIARLDAMGHTNRELRGLLLESGTIPEPGAAVFDTPEAGKEVGQITSSALRPTDARPLAMALLRTRFNAPDTTVYVAAGEGTVPATVFWPIPAHEG